MARSRKNDIRRNGKIANRIEELTAITYIPDRDTQILIDGMDAASHYANELIRASRLYGFFILGWAIGDAIQA